ncbi:hypothetical protein FRC08_008585 [Ceratobasidium sp. 394]|nr:hypothetical protein FRC08_008585 [Ceratobasidium sp. 394]KAG9078590.1 hypothetical protein FS749_009355 [Ceratobasidium sp. UAMH 11750]
MTITPLKQVVFVAGPWSIHVRSSIKSSTGLVEKFPTVFISMYIFESHIHQSEEYLSAQPPLAREHIHPIRACANGRTTSPLDIVLNLEKSFSPWIAWRLNYGIIEVNGLVLDSPSCIIGVHINAGCSSASKAVRGLPVVSWWPSTTASFMTHLGTGSMAMGAGYSKVLGLPWTWPSGRGNLDLWRKYSTRYFLPE